MSQPAWEWLHHELILKIVGHTPEWCVLNLADDELEDLLEILQPGCAGFVMIDEELARRQQAIRWQVAGQTNSVAYVPHGSSIAPSNLSNAIGGPVQIETTNDGGRTWSKYGSVCVHNWKVTQGIFRNYEDCIHCGAKREHVEKYEGLA